MADALLQVMKEKPFPKITVNEITGIAGVNRSTWHRWADEHGIKVWRRYTLDNGEDFFAFNQGSSFRNIQRRTTGLR